jgi:aspartate racemase
MKKKKIGLLGLGRRATDFYLQHLPHDRDHLHLIEVDFDNDINPYLPNNELMLDGKLRTELEKFDEADAVLIPNITLHETLDRIEPDSSHFPVVHAVRETIARLKADGVKKITLFGSLHTMNTEALSAQFEKSEIQLNRPSHKDQEAIDNLRRTIYAGGETQDGLEEFQSLLENYKKNGPVVLACTELSLVVSGQQGVVDMARVSIERAMVLVNTDTDNG